MVDSLVEEINNNLNSLRNVLISKSEYLLSHSHKNYFIFCSCMDCLEDAMLAINDYFDNGIGVRNGELYLRFYGLLQAIIIQQDSISEIFKLKNINYNLKSGFKEIRHFRNNLSGHPTNSQRGQFVHFLSRASINNINVDILSYNKDKNKDDITTINYYDLIINHLEELNSCLQELLIML